MDQDVTDPSSIILSDAEMIQTFTEKDIPFMINWSYAAHVLKDNPDIKMTFIPSFGESLNSSTVMGGIALGIAKSSKNKELAWKLIETINNHKKEISASDYTGSLPVWTDEIDNSVINQMYVDLNPIWGQFGYAINRPKLSNYSEWTKEMQAAITSALLESQEPKEALNEAKTKLEEKGIN